MSDNIVSLRGNTQAIKTLESLLNQLRSGKCPGYSLLWSETGDPYKLQYENYYGDEGLGLSVYASVGALNTAAHQIMQNHLDADDLEDE